MAEPLEKFTDEDLRNELGRRTEARREKARKEAEADNEQFFKSLLPQTIALTSHSKRCVSKQDDNPWGEDECVRCKLLVYQSQGFIDPDKKIEVTITVEDRSWRV